MKNDSEQLYVENPLNRLIESLYFHLFICREYIRLAINNAYEKIEIYLQRFQQLRIDHGNNLQMQSESIINETDIIKLRQYCARYSIELDTFQSILPKIRLGLFELNQTIFKEQCLPIVKYLLTTLETSIPERSVNMVIELEIEAEKILKILLSKPDKTIDCLAYIRYLDECAREIEQLMINIDYTFDCFGLMEEYRMAVQEKHKKSHNS